MEDSLLIILIIIIFLNISIIGSVFYIKYVTKIELEAINEILNGIDGTTLVTAQILLGPVIPKVA